MFGDLCLWRWPLGGQNKLRLLKPCLHSIGTLIQHPPQLQNHVKPRLPLTRVLNSGLQKSKIPTIIYNIHNFTPFTQSKNYLDRKLNCNLDFHCSIQQSVSYCCSLFSHCNIAIHLISELKLSRSQSLSTDYKRQNSQSRSQSLSSFYTRQISWSRSQSRLWSG